MWKGAVSFGLVTVPVRMYSATESHDLQFRQVRASDGSRVRYRRVAEADGEEVAYADIAKGYETPDGRMVVLTDSDLASLPNRSSKEISVEKFVPADQIDPIWLDRSYYLEPEKQAAKQYALLLQALRDTDRVAVATVSVRQRMTMAVLRARGEVIVLQTLLWPDEIRAADFDVLTDVPEPTKREVAMADLLVESLADEFDPDDYEDDYVKAVEELVAAKVAGGEVAEPAEPEDTSGQVIDLLAALQASVERAKAARGQAAAADGKGRHGAESDGAASDDTGHVEAGQDEAAPEEAAAPKEAASPRAAAKKAAAKKAAASRAAPSKGATSKDAAASKTASSKGSAARAAGTKDEEEDAAPPRRAAQ